MKAAVLDFDGVIARSIEKHAEAYRRLLAPYDIPVSDRDIFLREGARSESIINDLLGRGDRGAIDQSVPELADKKQTLFKELGTPALYPGAREMVRRIRDAAPRMALVTGTRFDNLERMIPDLLPSFDQVLAQDAYSNDKPHPEPYQKAAERLEVSPADCICLENAIRGVQSAKAAGYGHVVAIATTMAPEELEEAGADRIVEGHQEAADAVIAWLEVA